MTTADTSPEAYLARVNFLRLLRAIAPRDDDDDDDLDPDEPTPLADPPGEPVGRRGMLRVYR